MQRWRSRRVSAMWNRQYDIVIFQLFICHTGESRYPWIGRRGRGPIDSGFRRNDGFSWHLSVMIGRLLPSNQSSGRDEPRGIGLLVAGL
jgi:hypothetical protein